MPLTDYGRRLELEAELAEARAQIEAKDAALSAAVFDAYNEGLLDGAARTNELRAQIAAKDDEIARLQQALLKCATIPHMGQYTGGQVRAAIKESQPWSTPPAQEKKDG